MLAVGYSPVLGISIFITTNSNSFRHKVWDGLEAEGRLSTLVTSAFHYPITPLDPDQPSAELAKSIVLQVALCRLMNNYILYL